MRDDQRALEDDRRRVGEDFGRGGTSSGHELGRAFVESEGGPIETVGDQFADTERVDRRRIGESFADPNAIDDQKLGQAFADTNSSGKRRRKAQPEPPREHGSRRLLLWILGGIFLAFLLIFFLGYLPRHRRSKENAEKAERRRTETPVVEVQRVERAKAAAGLVVPGTAAPLTEAFVYARANGYLRRRYVDIGDHVRRGQVLALIDSPDLDQQVDQARQQLRQAEAQKAQQDTQLALTRITVERWRVLVVKGVFSRQDGDQREADYQAQLANVAAAERNVEAFRANLNRVIALQSYERVTAPFDGVVTSRNVDVGALISTQGSAGGMSSSSQNTQAGGTASTATTNSAGTSGNAPNVATSAGSTSGGGGALFSIAQTGRLRVLISVPEGYASAVHTGQKATLHFQGLAKQEFNGVVTRTAASIDPNTRTLLTEVQIANSDGRLMTGMYAVATFKGLQGPGPLTISGDSIAIRQDQNTVGLVSNGVVHLQPVEVGRDYGPVVEILSGLHEGDLIAASFTDDVREGAKVKVKESQTAGEARAPKSAPNQAAAPGGSTQYGNPSITDANLQGQAGKQKGSGGGSQKNDSGGDHK